MYSLLSYSTIPGYEAQARRAQAIPGDLPLVPQPIFTDEHNFEPPKPEHRIMIDFELKDAPMPGLGVPVKYILTEGFRAGRVLGPTGAPVELREPDTSILLHGLSGPRPLSMTLKIVWPGYTSYPFTRHISLDNGMTCATRTRLAFLIAVCLQCFVEEASKCIPDDANSEWVFGPGPDQLRFEDLSLVSISNTVGEYFQAEFRVNRSRAKN